MLLLLACTSSAQGPDDVIAGPSTDREEAHSEAPEEDSPVDEAPAYASSIQPLPEDLRTVMMGRTWKAGCPVTLDDLSLLEMSHWDFEGEVQTGQMVVATAHAEDVVGVFRKLFDAKFPVRKMRPASEYDGSDDASMGDDNTSAFNCRSITGGSGWSEHSYGHAIDLNPRENPYVKGSTVLPPEGAAYVERDPSVPGLVVQGDVVVTAFEAIGWGWGGNWSSLKDYQHFSATGN